MHPYFSYLLALSRKHHRRRTIQQIHTQLITKTTPLLSLHFAGTRTLLSIWNSLLRHYSLGPSPEEALLLYEHRLQNQRQTLLLDSFSYSFLIKACANLQRPIAGAQLHVLTFKAGFGYHVYVQTALVNMYVNCGSLLEASQVFDEMPERNPVTWNVLITGLAKWGKMGPARSVFDVMPMKNVVSWTGLIDGYTRMKQPKEALSLFRRMVVFEDIKPTEITILAIFPAIWNLGCINSCKLIHAYIHKSGFSDSDIRVSNSLIDSYANCGSMPSALKVFEDISLDRRNLVSWTSIISGFAMHGMGKEAVDNFRRMEEELFRPNRITFLSVLNACSHGGLVDEGLVFFRKMVNVYGIEPDIKHLGCLVDMLGRAGRVVEAEKIAMEIPKEAGNVVIWRILLGACSFQENVEIGERVMGKIMEMERGYGGDYVLLSNIFAAVGRFEDSQWVRRVMDERKSCKIPGISRSLA